jgi:uncharacterized protein (DUF849 family)
MASSPWPFPGRYTGVRRDGLEGAIVRADRPAATATSLAAYLPLVGELPWSVAVLGGDVVRCGLAAHALKRGGPLRVGHEDYAGARTPTNLELVREADALIESSGLRVATAPETRALLYDSGR